MNIGEYNAAKTALPKIEKELGSLRRNSPAYKKELRKYIESLITVKGHAWCMDVKAERKKMAKLLINSITKSVKKKSHL